MLTFFIQVKSILDWTSSKLHQTAGYRLVYPNFLEPYQLEDDATEALIEKGTVELTKLLETIEKIFLASDQYVTGDIKEFNFSLLEVLVWIILIILKTILNPNVSFLNPSISFLNPSISFLNPSISFLNPSILFLNTSISF